MLRTPLIEKILNTAEIHKNLIGKLLNGYEKGQTEGDSIHITNSANLPMFLKPQGQIMQDTRNGYNLLPLYKYIDVGFTKTINGITITVLDDFSIKVTGKRTSNSPVDFYLFGQFTSTADVLKLNGVYTFSISENPYTGIRGFLLHNSNIYLDTNINNKVISEELENIAVSALLIRIETDNELNEIIFPMLYEGSEEKEYEAFGQMPSTIFPSPIKNVEGNYKILNRNKNYFNFIKNVDKQTYIGITTSCYSNTIKANGTSTQAGSPLNEPIQFLKKGYYKVSINLDRSKVINIDNNKAYAIYFRDSEKNIITGFASNTNINSNIFVINLKLDEDITLTAQLFVNAPGITFNDLEIKIQIEKVEEGANTDIVEPELKELNLDIPEGIKLYGKEDGFVYLTEEQATELKVDGEGWYTVNNYNERDFSKEPLLTGKTAGPFVQGYYIIFDDIKGRASLDGNIIYSTHQKQKIPANPSVDAEWLKLDGNLIGQLYPSTHIGVYINYAPETKQEFVDWFNNLAPIIIYPLKKPAYTKITDKNFIKQLEELQKVFSHEGITNIDTYSTDSLEKAPLIISAEYLKSQKIINKNLETRLTALENALINNI